MRMNLLIDQLIADIKAVSCADPKYTNMGNQAVSAITASRDRALLPERGLSLAARQSITSAILRFVAAAMDADNPIKIRGYLTRLFKSAIGFLPPSVPKHEEPSDDIANIPVDWHGGGKGPFSKKFGPLRASIVRRPLLPGGDWTLCVNGIPFFFDTDPVQLALRGEQFLPEFS